MTAHVRIERPGGLGGRGVYRDGVFVGVMSEAGNGMGYRFTLGADVRLREGDPVRALDGVGYGKVRDLRAAIADDGRPDRSPREVVDLLDAALARVGGDAVSRLADRVSAVTGRADPFGLGRRQALLMSRIYPGAVVVVCEGHPEGTRFVSYGPDAPVLARAAGVAEAALPEPDGRFALPAAEAEEAFLRLVEDGLRIAVAGLDDGALGRLDREVRGE